MILDHTYQRHITLIMSLEIIWSWSFINLCSPSAENKSSNLLVKTLKRYFSYKYDSLISLNLINLTLELCPSLTKLIRAKREKQILILKKTIDKKFSCFCWFFLNAEPRYFLQKLLFLYEDFDKFSYWNIYWIRKFSLNILLP